MGSDCMLIAKVKDSESYEYCTMDRYYSFIDSFANSDFPALNEWCNDINRLIDWAKKEISDPSKEIDDIEYHLEKMNLLIRLMNKNIDRWDFVKIMEENNFYNSCFENIKEIIVN